MPYAIALSVVLVGLAAFQLALALGAPWGHFAWGGQHRVLPTGVRIGSVVLGIILNAISRSKPERYTMVPVVIGLAVLSLLIALG
ncbi:hypothetical protein [Microbacterium lacus]|uniref:hypothetical protein n=1 Tax=Microbacterium lacus TaxID=415217 RepID=UPI000C2CC48C|nr:hypothetical protein [Microbacterium lacus]